MLRALVIILVLFSFTTILCAQSKTEGFTWLNGTWEGTGYQIDTDSTWTMRLKAGKTFAIEYPSLKCGGIWQLISLNSWRARFREKITFGSEECVDNGNVVVDRLSRRQIAFKFSNPGSTKVSASAILNRKSLKAKD